MIEISHLTKRYGRARAVDDISFSVGEGEIVGFLGPNGAGKTTTMNIIAGYAPPTSGSVRVGGLDVMDEPAAVKRMIGYLPENPPLYTDMTVMEYLGFASDLKKAPRAKRRQGIDDALEIMDLGDHKGRLIKNLSKGYRQRVGFAQALLGEPRLLILDEPTVGLDPKQIIEIRKAIVELGKRHTIILSSHILQEVAAVCERVVIINKGRIVAVDTPENLSRGIGGARRLAVTVHGEQGMVVAAALAAEGVRAVEPVAEREPGAFAYTIEADADSDVRKALFFAMAGIGCPITEMRPLDMSLEEIFLELVAEDERDAGNGNGNGDDGHDAVDGALVGDGAGDGSSGARDGISSGDGFNNSGHSGRSSGESDGLSGGMGRDGADAQGGAREEA